MRSGFTCCPSGKQRVIYTLAITAIMTLGFAVIAMFFFVSHFEYILNLKRTLFFSAVFSFLLIPVGLYFGLKRKISIPTLAFILLLSGAAIAVRMAFFDYESSDYLYALSQWVRVLKVSPGLSGWIENPSDYNMPYLYFLTFVAKQPLTALYVIKLLSVVFDFILAYYVMRVSSLLIKSVEKQIFLFIAVLFLPTVFINSSYWGQCDVVYTAFAIAGIYYGITDRPALCISMLALGFSFKLQTIFILPMIFVFLFTKKIKLRHLLYFPAVFFVLLVPALLAGKPFTDTISIYAKQTEQYASLTLKAPSIYNLLSTEVDFNMFSTAGIMLAGAAVVSLLYYIWIKKDFIKTEEFLLIAFLFSLGIPFLLPRMHERYFYMADILSLFPFLLNRKRWFIPMIVVYTSFRAYSAFIFKMQDVNFMYLTILLLIVLAITMLDLTNRLGSKKRLSFHDNY